MKRINLMFAGMLLCGILIGWSSHFIASVPVTGVSAVLAQEEPATTDRGLFVNLTTDDTWSANMAISLAQNGVDQGLRPVVIFLNVRGVYLGHNKRLPAKEGNSDLNIHEKLQAFIESGGQVLACPSCSREAGLTQADYIDGVVLGEPGGALRFLTDPTITVISY